MQRKLYYILFPLFLLVLLYVLYKNFVNDFVDEETTNPLDPFQSNRFADSLHVSMSSTFLDFDEIKVVLSKLNKDSFAQVYNSFGKRGYIDLFGGHGTDLPFSTKLNLTQWLNEELDDDEKTYVRLYYPFAL